MLNRNKNSIVGFKIGDRTKRTYKKLFEEINNKYTVNYVCTDKLKTYTSYRYESDKNTINDRYIPNNKQLSENLIKKYKSDKDNELKQFSIHIRSKTEIQSPSYASLLAITNLLLDEARSQTETSLLDFGSLSFGEVPKRLQGARSTKWEQIKLT